MEVLPVWLWLWACSLAHVTMASSHVIALEAQVGSTVELPCPSNDDEHRFQFWQLVGDEVIGPGNPMNKTKYKYDEVTGKLYIKDVSTAESGLYRCFTKELTGEGIHILPVELLVRKDWEDEFETDHETNVFRALVVILVIIGLAVVGFLLYTYYSGQRTIHRITRLTEDECSEEPTLRGTYNSTTVPTSSRYSGFDNTAIIDTSFPSALEMRSGTM